MDIAVVGGKAGHKAAVKLLLAKDGVNPDSNAIWGRTPRWLATQQGHEAVVKLLLEKAHKRSSTR